MKTVFGIQGASYDGCNGWSTWQCDGLIFETRDKAQEYINKRWGTFGRYEPIEIEIK
jgi:hypothetical protein